MANRNLQKFPFGKLTKSFSGRPATTTSKRILGASGRPRVMRLGDNSTQWRDLYHVMLTLPWLGFLGLIALLYVGANALFALAYLLVPGSITGARPGSFTDAFFFSVQTMATIGYGVMSPQTLYAHTLVAIEALVGLLGVAMATGLMFSRFSRPTARVLFSRVAVVSPYNDVPTLIFRAANQRHNQILEAQVQLALVRDEVSTEGVTMRRFYDLKLLRSRTPIFFLTWTIMHPIDQGSPLYGLSPEELWDSNLEIVVILTGLDESFSQTIHARHSFIAEDIRWDKRFVDILTILPNGDRAVDYGRFHDVT